MSTAFRNGSGRPRWVLRFPDVLTRISERLVDLFSFFHLWEARAPDDPATSGDPQL